MEKTLNKELFDIASDMIANITHISTKDNPSGSGYYTICENTYDYNGEEIELELAIECCKYKDETDGRTYYGVYYVPEISGGDDISEPDWIYTEKCSKKQLVEALKELKNTYTRGYLWSLFEKTPNYGK